MSKISEATLSHQYDWLYMNKTRTTKIDMPKGIRKDQETQHYTEKTIDY